MKTFTKGIVLGAIATAIAMYFLFINPHQITDIEIGIYIGAFSVLGILAIKRFIAIIEQKTDRIHDRINTVESDLEQRVSELEYRTKLKERPKW